MKHGRKCEAHVFFFYYLVEMLRIKSCRLQHISPLMFWCFLYNRDSYTHTHTDEPKEIKCCSADHSEHTFDNSFAAPQRSCDSPTFTHTHTLLIFYFVLFYASLLSKLPFLHSFGFFYILYISSYQLSAHPCVLLCVNIFIFFAHFSIPIWIATHTIQQHGVSSFRTAMTTTTSIARNSLKNT